jgi:ABC-type uncharacterized transport system substrate-binding protein
MDASAGGRISSVGPGLPAYRLELIINLKTAKSLGIEIPAAFYIRADEVIETH